MKRDRLWTEEEVERPKVVKRSCEQTVFKMFPIKPEKRFAMKWTNQFFFTLKFFGNFFLAKICVISAPLDFRLHPKLGIKGAFKEMFYLSYKKRTLVFLVTKNFCFDNDGIYNWDHLHMSVCMHICIYVRFPNIYLISTTKLLFRISFTSFIYDLKNQFIAWCTQKDNARIELPREMPFGCNCYIFRNFMGKMCNFIIFENSFVT